MAHDYLIKEHGHSFILGKTAALVVRREPYRRILSALSAQNHRP